MTPPPHIEALALQLRETVAADPSALRFFRQELEPRSATIETELDRIAVPDPSAWSALFVATFRAMNLLEAWPTKPKPKRVDLIVALLEDAFASPEFPAVRKGQCPQAMRRAIGEALALMYALDSAGALEWAPSDKFMERLAARRLLRSGRRRIAKLPPG